ncbi:MAG: NAD(P)H-dependent oxidoreductase [Bacteroidales bacterium]|nr:NAD(P)H-dependent oxidoreductase [Bacteroidales bacterium]
MKKILIINGHEFWPSSPGILNSTLAKTAFDFFKEIDFEVKSTVINEGFNPEEEVEKYIWANVIIYISPVYWFDIPAGFKNYIEKVFSGGKGQLFTDDGRSGGGKYGTGGLLEAKKYMFITTWNAPEEAFNNATSSFIFENKSVDDVFLGFHAAQKFIGLKKMPGIHFFDVKRRPEIDKFKRDLIQHLHFNLNFK